MDLFLSSRYFVIFESSHDIVYIVLFKTLKRNCQLKNYRNCLIKNKPIRNQAFKKSKFLYLQMLCFSDFYSFEISF